MDAVLSGHAGVALLLDGENLSSLHFEDDGDAMPRSAAEVHLLFAGAQDLQFLENVGLEEVRSELDLAGTRVDALHLALNLLDAELSHGTRRSTAEDLEELLADERIVRWVESVLFAHPLPRSADPVGARSACTGRTERTRALLGKLESLQPVIIEVQQAWEAIPARLFATDEDRKHALSVAVKEGLFRDLVARRAAGERVDDFLLKSLMNPALRQIRDARHVLMEWVADFREPRKAPPPLEREISYVAEDTEWGVEEQGRRWVDVQSVREQIDWRKGAIFSAMGKGDLDQARHEIDQLVDFQLKHGEPVHACKSLCDLAGRAKDLGFHKLQLELTERSIGLKADDAWSWTQHGGALLRNGQLDSALRAYDNAFLFGERLVARTGRAEVLRAQNRLSEALAAYDSVVADFPGNVVARNGRAEVLRAQNRLSEALAAYDSVVADFPGNVVARTGRAEVLRAQNRPSEALAAYDSVIADFPGDVVARNGRAEVLRAQNHLSEALAAYDSVITDFPGDVVARNGRAEVLRAQNRLSEALAAYDSVVADFPGDVFARTGRAEVLRAQNRLSEALAAYDSVVADFPGNVVARTGRAEVLRAQNRLSEALLAYQSVMREFPGDLVARNGCACVLAALNRPEEALALLPLESPTLEQDWIGYHIRGMILLRIGHIEEAVSIFREGIEKNPSPSGQDYFRNALAIACLRSEAYSEATAVLSDVASPRLAKEATILRFHAFGGAGDLGRAAEQDRALESVASLPRVREIREELRRRYIERQTPQLSDEMLIRSEIDLLLAAA